MQPGGTQQGVGAAGHGRNPSVGPPGRSSSSSSASPSSSSSAVSAPHQVFDLIQQQQHQHQQQQQQQQHHHHHHQQQQQQQQQLAFRQSLQQHMLRKSEGDEALLAYQSGAFHGVMGGNNFPSSSGSLQFPQQSRKFNDLPRQHGPSQIRDESQNKGQGVEQHMQNPVHQAYVQYLQAAQQKSALGLQLQQQSKIGPVVGPSTGKDQDISISNLKMQELMSLQASNQAQASSSNKSGEHFVHCEQQMEKEQQLNSDQRNELRPLPQMAVMGQLTAANAVRSVQSPHAQSSAQNMPNNQLAMAAQLQVMQAWARESNVDLSLPANANLIAQLLPLMQSRMAALQKQNESRAGIQATHVPMAKQHTTSSPPVTNENSGHGNSSDGPGPSASAKTRQSVSTGHFATNANATVANFNSIAMQHVAVQGRENQDPRQPTVTGNGMPPMHPPQSSVKATQGMDHSLQTKKNFTDPETQQMQYLRQLQQMNRTSPQSAISSNEGGLVAHFPSQGVPVSHVPQQRLGFTKPQLHVLKAQILAFRRLKRGEGSLPQEVLRAIAPPPLESQLQQVCLPAAPTNHDRSTGKNVEEYTKNSESSDKAAQVALSSKGHSLSKEETFMGEEKSIAAMARVQGATAVVKEPIVMGNAGKEDQQGGAFSAQSEPEVERKSALVIRRCRVEGPSLNG